MANEKELLTASECILKYGLNWNVVKRPVVVDGVELQDYRAIVRQDNKEVFQVAGVRYEPIQNTEVFSFFDRIVQSGGAKYESAKSYRGGAVIALRVALPYDFEVLPEDRVKTYLDLVTSHDGSKSLSIVPRIYRQVCTNGLHAWVADYTRAVSVKHTQNAENRFITNAKEILEQEVAYFERFKNASIALARRQMTGLEIDNFLSQLFKADEKEEISTRAKNQMQEIRDLALHGKGQDIDGVRGTAWAVYNGVTEYVDHYRSSRGSDENREFSSDFGSGSQLRERAFELLTK